MKKIVINIFILFWDYCFYNKSFNFKSLSQTKLNF